MQKREDFPAKTGAAQQDLYTIFENITDFIALCDSDYGIIKSNPSATIILGGGESLVGSPCYVKFRGKDSPCEDCPIPETLNTGSVVALEYYNEQLGEHIEERAYPILSQAGELERFILVGRNVSDARESTEKIAHDSNKAHLFEDLSSGVAHDFNNVLTGILGRVRMMRKHTSDSTILKNLQVIETAALDGVEIVRRMQHFDREEIPEELETVDLKQLIEETVSLTRPKWKDAATAKGVLIEPVLELTDDLCVSGDPLDFRRAFTNIILNAMRAMPDGGVISIKTEERDGNAVIQIEDTGTGTSVQETRIELSETRGIVERYDGRMDVQSEPGKGTVITISLPIRKEIEEIRTPPRGTRVLVIDDQQYVLDVLEDLLTESGYEVTASAFAENGISHFKKRRHDIVITDLDMPEMSGWDVAGTIKQISPKTPVILVTGWALNLDKEKIRQNGVDFTLEKPFTGEELGEVISQAEKLNVD